MKTKIQLFITVIILSIFSMGFIYLNNKIKKKVAVINIQDTYKSFEMTKVMSRKFKSLTYDSTHKVDSLNMVLEGYGKIAEEDRNANEISKILHEAEWHQKDKDNVKYELEQQIWKQLNQYLIEFGKTSEYALIHGSMNEGSILYADEPVDITDDVIVFVNNKFKGIE